MRQNWKLTIQYNVCRLAAKLFQTLVSGLMAGLLQSPQELGVHLSLIVVILRMHVDVLIIILH